ncbi:MAG: hypothetical protein AAF740_12140 [Bacteroidota bacterium]
MEEKPDLPPFLKSWKQLYAIVLAEMLALIGLFYAFTAYFD